MSLRLRGCAASTFALRAMADKSARHARVFVATAVLVVTAGGSQLLACPMCFGAEETSLIDGTRLGILVLLGITLAVQGGFVGFFLFLRQRARRAAEVELDTEWSDLQRGPRTS